MAYNDIDGGKVLNKQGLLELCSQIKTAIANNSSSVVNQDDENGNTLSIIDAILESTNIDENTDETYSVTIDGGQLSLHYNDGNDNEYNISFNPADGIYFENIDNNNGSQIMNTLGMDNDANLTWDGVPVLALAPPDTDGTYILQCTVNNGSIFYEWFDTSV